MISNVTRIAAWLQPREILLDVDVRGQVDMLETMAATIGRAHGLDPAPIFRALSRREQAGSTALGDGFAIPHARIIGIESPLTFFMRAKRAIDFRAPDGKPVSDVLVIIVPADGARDDHLQLLGMVARLFSNRKFREQVGSAPDANSAAEVFRAGIARAVGAN